MYGYKPFKIIEYDSSNPEIPLAFYGSYWYDEKSRVYRFCWENELSQYFSNNMYDRLPHYFIVGVNVKKIN